MIEDDFGIDLWKVEVVDLYDPASDGIDLFMDEKYDLGALAKFIVTFPFGC